jgi:hypothetical protein
MWMVIKVKIFTVKQNSNFDLTELNIIFILKQSLPRSVEHNEHRVLFLNEIVKIGLGQMVQVLGTVQAGPLFFRTGRRRRKPVGRIVRILHKRDEIRFLFQNELKCLRLLKRLFKNQMNYAAPSAVRPAVFQVIEVDERGESLDVVDFARRLMDGTIDGGQHHLVVVLKALGSCRKLRLGLLTVTAPAIHQK